MEFAAELRHLTKAYGAHKVVNDLTFVIPKGQVVGLIGPNGAGKTTTMKMLLGLVRPSGGDAELLGTVVGSSGWGLTLKRVGSMIEEPPIYDRMSARENLQYQSLAVTDKVDNTEVDELLKLVDLADRADDRPRGYSLGMKQRLGIAISLIGSPDLVILDEPANGLDPAGIREIRTLLRRLPETGVTVLVSSHQLAEVQQACDQLVILANGSLVTQGTTDQILSLGSKRDLLVTVETNEAPQAIALLRSTHIEAEVSAGPVTPGHVTLSIDPEATQGGAELNRILAQGGIYASSIGQPTASLEDAFLDLVDPGATSGSTPASPPTPTLTTAGAAQ